MLGIEDAAGVTGLEYSYNAPAIRNSMAIWIRRAPKCNDGRDNDGDELIDYPDDPECVSEFDESEQRCGLLGIEVMVPIAWAMRLRRRQRTRKTI